LTEDEIKTLRFESWWVEGGSKNMISIVFHLDGQPHEVVIKDTKYFVKELFAGDRKGKGAPLTVTELLTEQCWDLHVGAKIDIFGKPTILKQSDLKTAEWNKFYGSFLTEVGLNLIGR